ncbi:hypothetical protein PF005_g4025 [Phytophthora fragariae]|uniref:Uncharacterized protein n=1 Tax=Phytophthora fragariae TaxID=53985 RepID=A0A6A3FIK5_9STRA|nr:hypothetical protein PF003_g3968 [Phytophthora fragariae]KAE8945864.1 hypothetical protein PF009_g4480 [Phytophthora fragariae]KAE9131146.1 hypothetical protein PF010_g3591 [Phytophthora fragariae]KAE9131383.1 hypothetical protein PF007_g4160 [Phytophthora fragariae]KAE9142894.1 hypothetical protein PF006_g12033 [Phytophthora fragariae]
MTPTSHGNCVRIPERQVSALEALKSQIGEPHGLRLNGYDAGEGWCMYGDGGAKQVSNQIAARDSWDGIQSYLYTEEGCHNLEARIACLVDEPTSDGSDAGRRPG